MNNILPISWEAHASRRDGESIQIITEDGQEIAFAYNEAHARLIAAAPNLLVELKNCRNKLKQLANEFNGPRFTDRHGDGPHCAMLCNLADKAIEKAEK